jgi:lysyl-tRNA synthetase class 1
MPHLDVATEMQKRHGKPLTEVEREALQRRLQSADIWVRHFARDEDKTRLQDTLPASVSTLSATQCAFLQRLGVALAHAKWEDDALQATVFETARLTPIEQPVAFAAIYRVLLDKDAGPKAGNLFAYLEREFLCKRFAEVPTDVAAFWKESALTQDQLTQWMALQKEKIVSYSHALQTCEAGNVLELTVEMKDGKRHLRRVWLESTPDVNAVLNAIA